MNVHMDLSDPLEAMDAGGPERDAFEPRYDDHAYFDEAVRAKRLNLLFHLVPYSDVLLVTGEPGSGKTSILQRLLLGANDNWRICHLQASAEIDGPRLLGILHKELSLRPDGSGDDEQRLRLLRESLYSLRHSALIPVLVIDDAHLLTQSALAMLATLTEPWQSADRLLSVVLFGEPEISKRLVAPGLEELRARVGHSFDIPPLSEEDTGKYIHHRLRAAGIKGEGPFTDSVVRFIHVASRGLPGRINEFARVVLQNNETKATRANTPSSPGSRRGTYLKYGAAAILVSLAVVGLLYQARLTELARVFQDTEALSPERGETPGVESSPVESRQTAMAPPPAVDSPAAVVQAPPDSGGGEAAPAVTEATDAAPETEVSSIATAVSGEGGAPDSDAAAPPASGEPEPDVEQTPAEETIAVEASDAADEPPVATESQAGGPRDEAWLLEQDPAAYTLQLLVASREQCLAYVKRYGLSDAAAVYSARSSGKVWSSLVYGVFATEEDAADAGKAISEQDVKASPWVRKLAVVQDRIRAFHAATAPAAIPAAPANIKGMAAPGGIPREDWLLGQPPGSYTLQLVSGKEANVMAYIKRHGLQDKVALYQPPDGPGRLTVTYGVYANRVDAVQAAEELATQLPDLEPWIRPLSEVHAVISRGGSAAIPTP
ncbi:MAG: AAA family ATPase [Gammaproteobacteria bacterium]